MRIQELYDLDIFIDGANIFNASGTMFLGATITEDLAAGIPVCVLKINIPIAWLDKRSIVDGTLLQFKLQCEKYNINEILSFRIYNIEKLQLNQEFCFLEISGLLDFYPGYQDGNAYNLYGTSSDVFKQVANNFKLNAEIDSTNDTQLWIAGQNNLYKFLMNTCAHGWINEVSSMFWCFDRHKILLYKNMTNLFRSRQNKIWTFIQNPNPDITNKEYGYSAAIVTIPSGTENLMSHGYGGNNIYFDSPTYSWKVTSAKKVVAETNLINISKELSKGLAPEWFAFDVGNYHPNYWIAWEQNERIKATYSTYVTLKCQFLMNYRLGQIVNFSYMDAQNINNKASMATGVFIINSITTSITTECVLAEVGLAMQGMNGIAATREVY